MREMTNKQAIEWFQSKPILKHLNIEGLVTPSDSPDMLLTSVNGEKIGIEVVMCYPIDGEDGRYNAMIHRADKACMAYKRHLKAMGEKGVFIGISFTETAYRFDPTVDNGHFEKIVLKEIETKREQAGIEDKLSIPSMLDMYLERMVSGYYDCKYVESVSIHRCSVPDLLEVTQVRTGYFTTVAEEAVLSCLVKKEKKLEKYKALPKNKGLHAYWLFICNPSNAFCDLDGFENPNFQTSFDRVYITDGGTVLQLK